MHINKPDNKLTIIQNEVEKQLEVPISIDRNKGSYFLSNTLVGFAIYIFTFFLWYFFKRGTFILEDLSLIHI